MNWWLFRYRCSRWREDLPMRLAWMLPRKVALWAFIRVMAATGDNPADITYDSAYKAWEAGAGK